MDALSILALAMQCVTAAPAPVVAALAIAESGGSAYSVNIAGERTDLGDFDGAVQTVALSLVEGSAVKIGMAGVPVAAFDERGVSYTDGFSACHNLRIAGEVLREKWQLYGGLDQHWRLAVLEYGTGEPGIEGPFAERFDAASEQLAVAAAELTQPNGSQQGEPDPAEQAPPPAPPSADRADANWDVYSRDQSRSLLIFSR